MNDLTRLAVREVLPGEIAHHYDPSSAEELFSTANVFFGRLGGRRFTFTIPLPASRRIRTTTRMLRRLTRADKSNAVFNRSRDGIVTLYGGSVFFYDIARESLVQTCTLTQCRNVLHQGIAVTERGIFFGEYGANADRNAVPVWASRDDGRTWSIACELPAGTVKHIHGIYADPHTDSLWMPTGDFANECFLFEAVGGDFSRLIRHGSGQQDWRPVSLFFEHDCIVWAMDSQLQASHLQIYDRRTEELSEGRAFPGPVWYSKQLTDGTAILQTTVEVGPGSTSDHAHLFASRDLRDWWEVGRYRKDPWPMRYFKFGVVAFADGAQPPDDFVIFGEALNGLDGRILRVGFAGL